VAKTNGLDASAAAPPRAKSGSHGHHAIRLASLIVSDPGTLKVFCSYRSTDCAAVEELARRLVERGVDAWFDRWEIVAGDDIVARMDGGVDGCEAALIFISEAWFDGAWAFDEYTSLALRKVEDGIRVIPIGDVPVRRLPTRLRKLARRSVEDFDSICDALLGIDHKPGIGSALRAAPLAVTITVEHVDRGALTTLSVSGAEDVCAEVAGGVIARGLDGARSDVSLAELGDRVAAIVFPGKIAAALSQLLDRVDAGTVVDLRVRASDALMRLPFEAARLPDGRVPALLAPVRMSRSLLGVEVAVAPPAPGPLKILVAVGAPDEGQTPNAPLDIEREMGAILDAAGEAVADDRAQVRILEVADVDSIEQALARDEYHVLHLSGHGAVDAIELEDQDGHAVAVSAGDFIAAFQAAGTVMPLVFVSACQGGDSARGFAVAMHRRGVARVVAMSGSVTDRYATDLAAAFYAQLSKSPAPRAGVCLAAARRELERARQRAGSTAGPPEWATPTVLLGGEDAAILDSDLDQRELSQPPVYAVGDAVPMLGMGELIGRRNVLRATLRALRHDERFTAAYGEIAGVVLTGIGGVGKSSVAGRTMARLVDDGWTVSATTGVWSLEHVCNQLSDDLAVQRATWARDLSTQLKQAADDDRARLKLLARALRDHRIVLVFDNFEDNLNDGATAFLDGPTAAVFRMLIDACAAGRVLLTCRYPVPGCMDALLEVAVGPLTAAETRRVFLRLQGLRELDRDDVLLVRSLIGGHPRALELLDALLRHGASVARVRTKLRELAKHEGY